VNLLHWRKLADKKTFREFTRISRIHTKKVLRTFPQRLGGEKQRKTTEDTELFHREHRDFTPFPLRLLCVLCG
ncbi:MAG: hypothetical protein PHN94_07680, partial [Bacteroidales bacterium]|nr:hypothetical protein [Bacteroidales bacterium]